MTQFDAQIKNKLEAGASLQGGGVAGGPPEAGGIGPAVPAPRPPGLGAVSSCSALSQDSCWSLWKIPETWVPGHLKMLGLDWWGLQRGDVMKSQVQVDKKGKIVDTRFETSGCGSAIASSLLATE